MDLTVADLTEDQVKELSARLQAIHTADADLANAVQVISVKVPTFWTARPEVWFIQLEAQFTSKNITAEETKFNHAVQGLDKSTAEEISTFLTIDTFGLTQDEKDSRLFAIDGLGDRKPSALLRHMESFVKADERKSTVFRALFLRNLPSSVRVALARNPPADLKDLAKAADAILAAEQAPPMVASVVEVVEWLECRTSEVRLGVQFPLRPG